MIKYMCDDCDQETTSDRVFVDNYDGTHPTYVMCTMCESYRLAFSRRLIASNRLVEKIPGGIRYRSMQELQATH